MILPYAGIHPRIHPTAFIAPNAVIIGNVVIGEEASVWFGAVLRGDEPEHEIRVGARTSIQDNVVLHVSRQGATVIGPGVTVGHGAVLESCVVGAGALIGMNAGPDPEDAGGRVAQVGGDELRPLRRARAELPGPGDRPPRRGRLSRPRRSMRARRA
jgi:serine acetyltransferase